MKIDLKYLSISFALFISSAAIAAPNLEPGLYSMNTDVEMPNFPGVPASVNKQFQHQNRQICIKESDLKSVVGKLNDQQVCKISNIKESPTEVTWDTDCSKKGLKVTGSGKVNLNGKSFSGSTVTETVVSGASRIKINAKFDGKHIGSCK